MNSIQEIDLYFRKISPNKGLVYLTDETNQPFSGLVLDIPSQIEPLLSKYSISDLKITEKRIELGQEIYQLFDGTPLFKHLKTIVQNNQAQSTFTRFVWHYHQNEKTFSNLYLELLHNGENFIFNDPFLLSARQPRTDSFALCKDLNSPVRILLLNQAASKLDSNAVIRALLPQVSQQVLEIEILEQTIDEDAAHYIATLQPHAIWYISNHELEKSGEVDSFNLARLIKIVPVISDLRLFVIEGLSALSDENEFSLTRWEPEFSNLQIPARIILPNTVSPKFKCAFLQQMLEEKPVDLALKNAQNTIYPDDQADMIPPILYIKSYNAIRKVQASAQILSPIHGNEATMTWGHLHRPRLTLMRNFELSQLTRALFEKNRSAIAICGNIGIGKSELIDQFIIQRSQRFNTVFRFQPIDVSVPHLIIEKISASLNQSEKCSANLDALKLNIDLGKLEWLTSALNQNPVLLIFEDIAPDTLASSPTLLGDFFRFLLKEIHQNTKIIFTSHRTIQCDGLIEGQIEILTLKSFQFAQTWELILHSETKQIPQFMMKSLDADTPSEVLAWNELIVMHDKLATHPMLIKLLRYSNNSISPADLQHCLLNGDFQEIQEMLFQKFEKMLSHDVIDLLVTCLCLPPNFEIDLLFFIYKQISANYEIIGAYLEELVYSGLIIRQFLELNNNKVKTGYQINPLAIDYLKQNFPERIREKRNQIFPKIGTYFENLAQKKNNLALWLNSINSYYKADQKEKAEQLTIKIFHRLIAAKQWFVVEQLLSNWLSNNFHPPQKVILALLEQSDKFESTSGNSAELIKKVESFLEKNSEKSNDVTFLMQLAERKKEQNDFAGAIKYFNEALNLMNDVPEFSEKKQQLLIELANCHYRIDEFQTAREYYEKATFIEKDAFVLFQLGNIHFMQKAIQATKDYYLEALYLAREIDSQRLIARILHQLGIYHTDLGDYQQAASYFKESISTSQASQEIDSYADSLHELANVQYLDGNYQSALGNYEKSFLISAEQGNMQDTAISLHQIGMTYHSMGDSVRAIEKLQESLNISEEIGDNSGILDTNYQLGSIYLSLGNERQALEIFQKCLAAARKNQDERAESDALHEIGYIYALQNNFQEAKEKFEASLEISKKLDDKKRIEGTTHELNQISDKLKATADSAIFSSQAGELMHE